MDDALIDDLRRRVQAAPSICVLTGAGMSAESGIPTFRDALTGLWAVSIKIQPASSGRGSRWMSGTIASGDG